MFPRRLPNKLPSPDQPPVGARRGELLLAGTKPGDEAVEAVGRLPACMLACLPVLTDGINRGSERVGVGPSVIAAILKTAVGESPPGVRIPPYPLSVNGAPVHRLKTKLRLLDRMEEPTAPTDLSDKLQEQWGRHFACQLADRNARVPVN